MKQRLIRPLWVAGATWALVCLGGVWLPTDALIAVLAVGIVCAVLTVTIPRLRCHHGVVLSVITAVVACGVLLYWQAARFQPTREMDGREVFIHAEVQENEAFTELEVLSGDLPSGTRLELWAEPLGTALDPHDQVAATFDVHVTSESGLTMMWDKADGVWLAVIPTDLSGETWNILESDEAEVSALTSMRRELAVKIQQVLPGDVGAVVTGICLGMDEHLSSEATANFRACGVSHLFAVSGLHLSILTQALLWLLRQMRTPRRLRGVICALAVVLFSALVGWTPSVLRAGTLCLIMILGECMRRRADARNSLGAALLLLLFAEPFAVYDVGLLLSFTATFGLLFVTPKLRDVMLKIPLPEALTTVWNGIVGAVSVTAGAMLLTLPITILYFGTVSVAGLIANLLMTLPASLLLIVGWIAILTLPLGLSFVYYPLLMPVGWLARFLLWIAGGVAELPFAVVSVTETYLVVGIIGSLLIVAVTWGLFHGRGVWLVTGICMTAVCIGAGIYHYRLADTVRFLVIPNETDLSVCMLYRDQAVLITAPSEANTVYEIRSALQREGVLSLDAVVLPHNESRGSPYMPHILGSCLEGATVYSEVEAAAVLADDLRVYRQGSWCIVRCGSVEAAFSLEMTTEAPTERVDVLFCTHQAVDTADDTVQVIQQASALYALPPHGIAAPNEEELWIWVESNGSVSIK